MLYISFNYRELHRLKEAVFAPHMVNAGPDLPVSWPGRGVGRHRQAYLRIPFGQNPVVGKPPETHMLDSHTGTHLVPPTYALPHYPPHTKVRNYDPVVNAWLQDYERQYGPLPVSQTTADKVPARPNLGLGSRVGCPGIGGHRPTREAGRRPRR